MIADQDAVKLVRRAMLVHIRDLVDDLVHWTDQLELLEAGSFQPSQLESTAKSFAQTGFPPAPERQKPSLSDFLPSEKASHPE